MHSVNFKLGYFVEKGIGNVEAKYTKNILNSPSPSKWYNHTWDLYKKITPQSRERSCISHLATAENMLKAFSQTNCHFHQCQAYRHSMLQKLTLIWMITKSLSHAKSLELFSTQFCKGNSKLSCFSSNFPCASSHQNILL